MTDFVVVPDVYLTNEVKLRLEEESRFKLLDATQRFDKWVERKTKRRERREIKRWDPKSADDEAHEHDHEGDEHDDEDHSDDDESSDEEEEEDEEDAGDDEFREFHPPYAIGWPKVDCDLLVWEAGTGLGRYLFAHVHQLCGRDPDSPLTCQPVSPSLSNPSAKPNTYTPNNKIALLDISSGTGIAAISWLHSLAHAGHRSSFVRDVKCNVVLTDLPPVLPLTKRNTVLNLKNILQETATRKIAGSGGDASSVSVTGARELAGAESLFLGPKKKQVNQEA